MRPGVSEILLILVVVLVIFGPRKLPDIGRALGKSISEFKNATRGNGTEDAETNKSA